MIQSGYHCLLLDLFQFIIQYNPTIHSVRQWQWVLKQITRELHTFEWNRTTFVTSILDTEAARCVCRSMVLRDIVKPPGHSTKQETPRTKLHFAPRFTGYWRILRVIWQCFWNLQKTVGAVCAVLRSEHLPLHLAFTGIKLTADKSTIDRHMNWRSCVRCASLWALASSPRVYRNQVNCRQEHYWQTYKLAVKMIYSSETVLSCSVNRAGIRGSKCLVSQQYCREGTVLCP